jgi:hypothetical protein
MNAIVQYEEIGSPLAVETVKHQIQVIQQVMRDAMVKDTHYGVVPGCGDKPTLLKAGAEKLSLTFRLAPTYVVTKTELGAGHREYEVRCTLTHIPTDKVFGEGVGICSSHESKYRYRKAERVCPKCSKDTIIKGREEYGGGWLCFAKKGGCGAKFKDDDEKITGQQVGRIDNPDIADIFNTILKMAKKRAHVDAVLTATAASDIFAQDLEDLPKEVVPEERPPINHDPIDQHKVFTAVAWFKDVIDADQIDLYHEKVKAAWERLSNDERMAVHEQLGDKANGSKRMYKNILKLYLDHVPEESIPEGVRE